MNINHMLNSIEVNQIKYDPFFFSLLGVFSEFRVIKII